MKMRKGARKSNQERFKKKEMNSVDKTDENSLEFYEFNYVLGLKSQVSKKIIAHIV